jgi:hypothetical protein
MLRAHFKTLIVLLAGIVTVAAWAHDKPPEVDKDGLHLVHDSDLRQVYTRPGVDFGQFNQVILVDAYVAFRKNWQRDQNETDPFKIRKRDVEAIKKRVGTEFHKAFAAELEKKGMTVVPTTATGEGVLIVRPAIINLDVEAPDTMSAGMNTTMAASAGQMTLYAELYDSVSNQLIGRVVDPEADRGFGGQFMAQNSVTNKAAEDKIVKRWADALAGHLHHVVNNP